MQTFKQMYEEELKKLVEEFDKRHEFYQELENYKFNYGKIPEKFLSNYAAWMSDGKKYWKKIPGVWAKIKKTARLRTETRIKNEKNN